MIKCRLIELTAIRQPKGAIVVSIYCLRAIRTVLMPLTPNPRMVCFPENQSLGSVVSLGSGQHEQRIQ